MPLTGGARIQFGDTTVFTQPSISSRPAEGTADRLRSTNISGPGSELCRGTRLESGLTFCRTSDVLHTINHLSSSPRRQHSGNLGRQNTSCRPPRLQSIPRAAQPASQAGYQAANHNSHHKRLQRQRLPCTRGRGVS